MKDKDQDLLNLPIQERRLILAQQGQARLEEWKQSDFFKREQLAEQKKKEQAERRLAAAARKKFGGKSDTMGDRAHQRKLDREAARAAAEAAKAEVKLSRTIDFLKDAMDSHKFE